MKNEQDGLLDEFKGSEKDVFADRTVELPENDGTESDSELMRQNRKNRRLDQRLKEAEILNAQLNERIKVLSEVGKFKQEATDDDLAEIDRIYGTDTPEHIAAGNILKKALRSREENAVQKALERIQSERTDDAQEQREEDKAVDDIEERIEDEYGIDMSNQSDRSSYFALMERMSPKDQDGNVKEYADPDAVAETFLRLKERANSRRQELSARSMTRSGQSQPSRIQEDAMERWIQENDLLPGQ
jgi:hypothetical protein